MKKIFCIFITIIILCSCSNNKATANANDRYENLINLLKENESFQNSSNYFDLSVDMGTINDGYRFYLTIDDAHSAMYNVEAIAIEKNVNYINEMAASIGIFEETEYNMIPNQANVDKGYVEGLVLSGTTKNSETTLYVLVQWYNKDYSTQHREFFQIDAKYE